MVLFQVQIAFLLSRCIDGWAKSSTQNEVEMVLTRLIHTELPHFRCRHFHCHCCCYCNGYSTEWSRAKQTQLGIAKERETTTKAKIISFEMVKRILIGCVSYCNCIFRRAWNAKHYMPVLMSHSFAFALHLVATFSRFHTNYLQQYGWVVGLCCHRSPISSPLIVQSDEQKMKRNRNVARANRMSKTNQIRMNESHFHRSRYI